MSLRCWRRGFVSCSAVAIAIASPSAAQAIEPDPTRLFVRGPVVIEITRALHGALRKLQTRACQQIFTDFTDEEGRTLQEALGPLTPAEHLTRIFIRDGEIPKGSGRCAVPGASAFTTDGAVVFICGNNFRSQSPRRRETALIHEMLHTLGLRENPPSSAAITRQVEQRCGS